MKQKNYSYNNVPKITSIKNMLELAVDEAGDSPAFKYKDKSKSIVTVTYTELMHDVQGVGTALSVIDALSSHIAVIGENSYDWVCVYLAALMSRGVFVPLDKELPLEDIITILRHSDSEVLFYAPRYEKYIDEIAAAVPSLRFFIGFGTEIPLKNRLSYREFLETGRKMLKNGDTVYTSIENDISSLKMIVYTSGTTGMSKGVMLSEDNLISMVYYALRIATIHTKCLSVLPYHHTYEGIAGLLVALHHHSCICINESMKAVLKNLQLYQPDYIYVVPAFVELFYKKIMATVRESGKEKTIAVAIKLSNALRRVGIDIRRTLFKSIHEAFGGNLVEIVSGGAPLRRELGDFFNSVGFELINGYGITECSPLISVNREKFNDCATVGVPMECLDVRFENVTSDGEGEICVKGKTVMLGYYKNEEMTREVIKDGWFSTGDYGKMNEKGQLLITGRKKNIIVLDNGKNIFPEEIENYIQRIPYVKEVIVRGLRDESGNEVGLTAEIFPAFEEAAAMGIKDIEKSLRSDIDEEFKELPVYKRISKITVRENEFAKTTTNKIKR